LIAKKDVLERVVIFSIILSAFVQMKPYFVWSSFSQSLLVLLPQATIMTTAVLCLVFLYSRRKIIDRSLCGIILAFSLIWLYRMVAGEGNPSLLSLGNYFFLFSVVGFLSLDSEIKKDAFRVFSVVFALSLVSGIVLWFLLNLGFELPYQYLLGDHVGKVARGGYYRKYFGAAFLYVGYTPFIRLSALYDEPGVVGTFAALFIIADDFRIRKPVNIVIAVGGFLSLSLAFFLLTISAVIVRSSIKNLLRALLITAMIVVLYFVFINYETSNTAVAWLQNRLRFDVSGLAGDNRTDKYFDYEFASFLNSGDFQKMLFGKGPGAAVSNLWMSGSATYKSIIYDYGILGFASLIIWFAFAGVKVSGASRSALVLIAAFLLSIYQRPSVFALSYILLLLGGCANLRKSRKVVSVGVRANS